MSYDLNHAYDLLLEIIILQGFVPLLPQPPPAELQRRILRGQGYLLPQFFGQSEGSACISMFLQE